MKTEGDAARLEKRIKSIKTQLLAGAAMLGAGAGILYMFKRPLEEAKAFQTEVAKFQLFGLGDAMTAKAAKFAQNMNIIGTSSVDAMRLVNEAQGVFRESGLKGPAALQGAFLAAPMLAKIEFATRGLDADTQARIRTQELDMLRFVEMRGGLVNATTFNRLANEGWKAIRSSGGNVNWSQLRQFMSTGSVAAQGLTDVALFGQLEPIIGEMKGGRAGHAFMTAYSRVNGLQRLLPRIMTREMLRLGLWDTKHIEFNSQGGVKSFIGDPLKQNNLFSSSPFEYYQKVVLPAYAKAGITKPQDVYRENAILFGNTGGQLFSIMYRQQQNIERSVEAQRKTLGVDQSDKVVGKTLAGKQIDLHAKFSNLMLNLGNVALPIAIKGLEWLIPKVKWLGDFLTQHPRMFAAIVKGLIDLGAALMIGGAINIFVGGIRGLNLALGIGKASLAAKLTESAGAVGRLQQAGSALVAAAIGWEIGSGIYKYGMENNASGRGLGAFEAHVLAFFGNKDAQEAVDRMNGRGTVNHSGDFHPERVRWAAHVRPAAASKSARADDDINLFSATHPIQVHTTVNLDGKKIATVVTQHQAKAASSAQAGTSRFDLTSSAPPIGLNLAPVH